MIETTTIKAEDAPIGQLLWAVKAPEFAPNFTLSEVQIVRNAGGTFVRWVYEGDVPDRTFKLGEEVSIMSKYEPAHMG